MFYSNLKKAFEGKIVWKSNSCGMEAFFSHVLPQWFPNLAWSAYKLKNQKISPNAWVTSEFQDCAFFSSFCFIKYHFSSESRILFSVKCVHYLLFGYIFKNTEGCYFYAYWVNWESVHWLEQGKDLCQHKEPTFHQTACKTG